MVTITISIFQGVILIIARVLAEPFYKFHLWREFCSWFGELHDYKSQVDGGDGDELDVEKSNLLALMNA